jgi:uncharacterized protein YdhG (YjbR/CyaY superfamily)
LPTALLAVSSKCPTYTRSRGDIQRFGARQNLVANPGIQELRRRHVYAPALEKCRKLAFDTDEVQAWHAIIGASAPALSPKTWYGMPAYAKDGNVVCFFQSAQKFKTRYATFGFSDKANLDEGAMWPTTFALKELTSAEEARIGALVKKAVS